MGQTAHVEKQSVIIRFAGDSGDGMQTVGAQFTDTSALFGNDVNTFPDFPAEIRAPQGTLPGVSGFQVHIGSVDILTSGDRPDALVAMNPAALKVCLSDLIMGGLLIVNTDAFTEQNLKKAGYESNPLDDPELEQKYHVLKVAITSLTEEALKDSPLKSGDIIKCKNFFAMGLVYWIYGRPMDYTLKWIEGKWSKKPEVVAANSGALKAGYHLGETTEMELPRYQVAPATLKPGLYRKITGNDAFVLGMLAAQEASWRDLVYASYPITPASSILEGIARHKNYGVKTVQAEDEIAAVGVAIGASYAGNLGVTGTSGPGICLKSEFMGLANIVELPLVVINVQRAGPSTGMPTKMEQSDLLQAMYGRNGESPMPVFAASSPGDCFHIFIEAAHVALKYRTPIIILSDNYIANGSEPWLVPDVEDLPNLVMDPVREGETYIPYQRDPETMARRLAIPGRPGFEHRVGGLEKNEQGGVSYDPDNHQKMVNERQAKVDLVANTYAPIEIEGDSTGDLLVIGWGGASGAIRAACDRVQEAGKKVSVVILRHLNPLPNDLEEVMDGFKQVLVPELNNGQLSFLIQGKYGRKVLRFNKVQGKPFMISELVDKINEVIS